MVRARITAVDLRRPDLRRPFPRHFAQRVRGHTVQALTRRAKYLLASLSSGETLLMHLGMSGSFRVVSKPKAQIPDPKSQFEPHDHVVLHMSSGKAVVFNDPRRFGVMDLLRARELEKHPVLSRLGPEPLSSDFDAGALARACRGRRTSLKVMLLDQRVVAGLGNIYASEALHVAGLSPRCPASILATSTGTPREAAYRLTTAIKRVLERAISRQMNEHYRGQPFKVYDREDEPCLRENCAGTIRRLEQAGRSTFYCGVCQR
jgi:formamidopyrimidine-DNA glycosylase